MPSSSLCIEDPNNKFYKYAIRHEINLGKIGATAPEKWPPSLNLHPKVNKYKNSKLGINSISETAWLNILRDFKPLKIGLSLGTGTGRHSEYLQKTGIVLKWVSIDLVKTKNELLIKQKRDNKYFPGDLNFIDLPENSYDIILCIGVLHHIINLEQLIYNINKSLKESGVFVVNEYIGEDKWQWEEKKMVLVNEKLKYKFKDEYPALSVKKRSLAVMNDRPLESIRSSIIPSIIHEIFRDSVISEEIFNPVLYPILNSIGYSYAFKKQLLSNHILLNSILDFAIQLDSQIDKSDYDLMPTELVGIYKKNHKEYILTAPKWTENEIKAKLGSRRPFYIKIKRKILGIKYFRYLFLHTKKLLHFKINS